MDTNCFDISQTQLDVLVDSTFESEIVAHSIFALHNEFVCEICKISQLTKRDLQEHVVSKQHCNRIKNISANCTMEANNVICKLCTDYIPTDWKTFIYHFHEQNHFNNLCEEDTSPPNEIVQDLDEPHISYALLVRNQMILLKPEDFFCCGCFETIIGWGSVLVHIAKRSHDEVQKTRIKNDSIDKCSEAKCQVIVNNYTFHVEASKFYCHLCHCAISSLQNCFQHIKGTCHTVNMKAKKDDYQPISQLTKETQIQNAKWRTMQDNLLTEPSKSGTYICNVCTCSIPGWINVSAHISGKRHQQLMKNRGTEIMLPTKSNETSNDSSGSWETIENSSSSWESYDGSWQTHDSSWSTTRSWTSSTHSLSYSESSGSLTNGWQTVNVSTSMSNPPGAMLFHIPQHLTPLISEHMLEKRADELYCVACNAHLRSLESLEAHTNTVRHTVALRSHKVKIAQSNTESAVIAKTKGIPNSHPNSINKKQLQPAMRNATTYSVQENIAPTLLKIPQKSLPLISKHLLLHKQEEIYCVACDARLQSEQTLIAHTKSKNHVAKLKKYKDTLVKKRGSADIEENTASCSHVTKSSATTVNNSAISETGTTNPSNLLSSLFEVPKWILSLIKKNSLQHMKDELYCKACNSHLKSVPSIIAHTKSPKHVTKLKQFQDKDKCIKNQLSKAHSDLERFERAVNSGIASNSDISSLSETIANLKITLNKAAISETDTTNPPNLQSSLFKVPKWILSIIKKNSLQHMKDELYCTACNSHLQNVPSIIAHTKSPKHVTNCKLKQFQDKDKCNKNQMSNAHSDLERTKRASNSGISSNSDISSLSETIANVEITLNKMMVKKGQSEKSALGNTGETKTNVQKRGNSKIKPPKPKKPQKQKAAPKRSRAFDPRLLIADVEHIYQTNPEKLRIIELSCQLCFPKTSNELYCLICENSVDSNVQIFYEHICSAAHTTYLSEAERIDELFKDYPDQFSDLALAKEFMLENSEKSIQCFACDSVVGNDKFILEHLTNDFHNKAKQSWNDAMQKIRQDILVAIESTWYNIQKYWCQPCKVGYNTEFHFAAHLESKKHQESLTEMGNYRKELIYDSCIPCAILWLGVTGVYTIHTSDRMHKWLVHSGDYSKFPLPNQTKILLKNPEAEVMSLIEMSDQVLTIEKAKVDTLLKCLEDTVKCTYHEAKAYPFGSRVSGLGFPDSDIDVSLDCGTCNENKAPKNCQLERIKSVERCLSLNEQAWEIDAIVPISRTPIIKVRHRDTGLSCDISFKNGLSVENTRLIKCYIDNFPPCRKLMLFMKKWFSSCKLSGSQNTISSYAVYCYVIFYLQVEKIVPSVANLITKQGKSKIIDGWETGICESFEVGDEHKLSLTQLLHGFFDFYSKFDHRHSVACPIIGRAIPKLSFVELDLLPEEMVPYVNHIRNQTAGSVELFRIDSEMCIQDPYDLSHNLTKAVGKSTLNRFKRLCAASANYLSDFIGH